MDYFSEHGYARALESVAMGATVAATLDYLCDRLKLDADDANRVMTAAYFDALEQGVEEEDIDPTWRIRARRMRVGS